MADDDKITCRNSKKLVRLLDVSFCPHHQRHRESFSTSYFLTSSIFIVVVVALLISLKLYLWLKSKKKVFKSLPALDDTRSVVKIYDAFISYSHEDEKYVADLIRKLEERNDPFKLCVHVRNWIPGEFILKQMADSIHLSRNTVIIFSPAYLKSKWCHSEFRIALTEKFITRSHKIIAIWYWDADPKDCQLDPEFNAFFCTCTYLKYDDQYFLRKLESAIGRTKKCIE